MGATDSCPVRDIEKIRDRKKHKLSVEQLARIEQKFGVKKKVLIPRDINSVWENYLVRNLNRQFMQMIFRAGKKNISWNCFLDLYLNLVEESKEIQAITIMTLLASDSSDVATFKSNMIPLALLYGYFRDIIASYIKILRYQKNSELDGWLAIDVSLSLYECFNVGKHLSYYIEHYNDKVGLGSLEAWLFRCGVFKNLSDVVFKTLFNLIRVEDEESLVPNADTSIKIITVLDLCHIILLNSIIPSSIMNRWRLLFANLYFDDTWDCMLSNVIGQGPTLIFVEDTDCNLFGAFTGSSWYPSPDFFGSELCFIFTLRPEVNIYYASGYDRNFQYFNVYNRAKPIGLGIGGLMYSFGLFLHGFDWGKGSVSESCTTFKLYLPPCKYSIFQVKRLEIWGLGNMEYSRRVIEEKLLQEVSSDNNKSLMTDLDQRRSSREINIDEKKTKDLFSEASDLKSETMTIISPRRSLKISDTSEKEKSSKLFDSYEHGEVMNASDNISIYSEIPERSIQTVDTSNQIKDSISDVSIESETLTRGLIFDISKNSKVSETTVISKGSD